MNGVSIELKSHDKLLVGCVFRSKSRTELKNARLCQLIQQSSERDYSHIIIEGYFHYPEIEWTTWTTMKSAEHHSQKFIVTCRDAYMYHHIQEPTRYIYGQQEHLLDLVITNEESMLTSVAYLPGLGIIANLYILHELHVHT